MMTATLGENKAWPSIARTPGQVVIGLILAFSAYRLILAGTLGLGVDESYGIGVSHDLELSYFDHPPLNYWITHAFIPLLGDGRALRLPFIALFAATNWFLYLFTKHLFGAVAGAWAVLALNLALFFTVAGGWILPDGPLMLGLVTAAYTLARGLFPAGTPPSPWRTWLGAGFWIGLAGLSKYHAVLFVAGLLLYFVSAPGRRKILLHPAPWAGAALALAMVTPVLVWNVEHHWVSFLYQGGRADAYGGFPKIGQFFANLGGQILWMAPWVFGPMVVAAYFAVRAGRGADRSWYCLCLGMPTILLFTLVPLWGGRGLPHWQMPGWLMLFPVLGDHLAREAAVRSRPRTWAIWSSAALAVVTVLIVGDAATGYGRLLFPTIFAKGDPTLEALEWTPLRSELRRRNLLGLKGLFVVSASPIDIGKIDQALDDSMPMLVYGESKQYAFRYDPKTLIGHDALIIGSRNMSGIGKALAPYFQSIEELPAFTFGRSGMDEVTVRILYGHDFKKPWPSPYAEKAD
ncbi:MAG: ArnT family glycosyltransferase [Xanthobacteraceae bacterium]